MKVETLASDDELSEALHNRLEFVNPDGDDFGTTFAKITSLRIIDFDSTESV